MTSPVLVIGGSGQVGANCREAFVRAGRRVVGTWGTRPVEGLTPLDLADEQAVRRMVRSVAPDTCLLAAALTDVERCEREPDLAMLLNGHAPGWVAEEMARLGGLPIFLSSEYVFSGVDGPHDEAAEGHPISAYGRSKLEGEARVRASSARHLVVRTTVVYGWQPEGRNFLMTLWRSLRSGRPLRVPCDQSSSPTYAPDLAAAIVQLAARGCTGTWNVAGPEVMTRDAMARRAARVLGLPEDLVEPVPTAALGQLAPRPLRAGLLVDKLRAELGDVMRSVEDGTADAMRQAREQGLDAPPP